MSLLLSIVAEGVSLLNKKKQHTEGFNSSPYVANAMGDMSKNIMHILNLAIAFYAFYLAFKCIRQGKNAFVHLLGACCCSLFYVAYAIATGC